jgi:restriction endonuclease
MILIKKRFKRQEHFTLLYLLCRINYLTGQTFIDWFFIAVPAKIIRSGYQMEIKLYEHHFYKVNWEELDRLIEVA